jgi:hypothetical protein
MAAFSGPGGGATAGRATTGAEASEPRSILPFSVSGSDSRTSHSPGIIGSGKRLARSRRRSMTSSIVPGRGTTYARKSFCVPAPVWSCSQTTTTA